jgi:hypothetical protein
MTAISREEAIERWFALDDDERVGQLPDRQVAKSHGISQSMVRRYRYVNKIPSFDGNVWPHFEYAKKVSKDPELATMSIKVACKHYKVSNDIIMVARHLCGLRWNGKSPRKSKAEIDLDAWNKENTDKLTGWKCIPERVGKTKNEWRNEISSGTFN